MSAGNFVIIISLLIKRQSPLSNYFPSEIIGKFNIFKIYGNQFTEYFEVSESIIFRCISSHRFCYIFF